MVSGKAIGIGVVIFILIIGIVIGSLWWTETWPFSKAKTEAEKEKERREKMTQAERDKEDAEIRRKAKEEADRLEAEKILANKKPFTCATPRNTSFQKLTDNVFDLANHTLKCDNGGINRFHLKRDEAGGSAQYEVTCCTGGNLDAVTTLQRTDWVDADGKKTLNLDKLNVSCPENNVLSTFKIGEDGKKYQYVYGCMPSKIPLKCEERSTDLDADGGGSPYFLDRQDVRCHDNEAIQNFRLVRDGNKIQYKYTCCTPK